MSRSCRSTSATAASRSSRRCAGGDGLALRRFVVGVKGTRSDDPAEWLEGVERHIRSRPIPASQPVYLFVVNTRTAEARYALLIEPVIAGSAALRPCLEPTAEAFRPVDAEAMSDIGGRVEMWYDALGRS